MLKEYFKIDSALPELHSLEISIQRWKFPCHYLSWVNSRSWVGWILITNSRMGNIQVETTPYLGNGWGSVDWAAMQSHERREEGENDLGTGQGRAQAGEGHMENGLDIYVYFNFFCFYYQVEIFSDKMLARSRDSPLISWVLASHPFNTKTSGSATVRLKNR